jgi:hypothetical protein
MKRILLLICLFAIYGHSELKAQFINNKININVSYGLITTLGPKDVNEESFITPSLYIGYENAFSVNVRGVYTFRPNISLGMEWSKLEFSNWSYNEEQVYQNASSSISNIGPVIKLHTKFKQVGIGNRVEGYTIVLPYIAFISTFIPQENLFSIDPPVQEPNSILESNTHSLGIKISIGGAYSVSQNIDFFVESGVSYTSISSQLYNDKRLLSLNTNLGVVFKFLRNRRYYL